MSQQKKQNQIDSISSISLDPALRDFGVSTIFGGRKSSFDYVNILKDSDQLSKKEYRNSLDILASNINHGKQSTAPLRSIIQVYNDQAKVKIQQDGAQALQIGEVYSQSQNQQSQNQQQQLPFPNKTKYQFHSQVEQPVKLETVYNEVNNQYTSYFPYDLATVLRQRQIPLLYVRGLLMARNLKQIKSTRRLKVERYLQKRRKKTWNRKICYNCRQKVAEERLRIKGKFIKKRRAMEMLGIQRPIDMGALREMLEQALKNKNSKQIDELIKNQKYLKNEEESDSYQEPIEQQSNEEDSQRAH